MIYNTILTINIIPYCQCKRRNMRKAIFRNSFVFQYTNLQACEKKIIKSSQLLISKCRSSMDMKLYLHISGGVLVILVTHSMRGVPVSDIYLFLNGEQPLW